MLTDISGWCWELLLWLPCGEQAREGSVQTTEGPRPGRVERSEQLWRGCLWAQVDTPKWKLEIRDLGVWSRAG